MNRIRKHPWIGLFLLALAFPCAADISAESEKNDSADQANGPVGPASTVGGLLSSPYDVDWFWFDLPAPVTVDINLNHGRKRNFDWDLFGADGSLLASGASETIPETGSYAAGSAGRYFLKVSSRRGRGSFQLDVSYDRLATDLRPAPPGDLQHWIVGDPQDSSRQPSGGPAMLLMGGNFEVDAAFAQRAFPVANGGDVVVLRTSGADGYNDYLYNLVGGSLKPDSVETLLVDTRAKADSAYADWVLRHAELVFMAGGDQSDYLNAWKDTRVASAIRIAYQRGAVVGGLSAGLAVQGQYIYDPDGVAAATSAEALANPYRSSMLFASGFLDLPLMRNIITDTHFAQRDRMGRLLAFMARLRQDAAADRIVGLGIDENTSLFIDRNGDAVVDGDNSVYLLRETFATQRTQVGAGLPLVYRNLHRTRLTAGMRLNVLTGTSGGIGIPLSADARSSPPLLPANPY